ncbi:MAG: hypothetical protein SGBAC_010726 [Bacillariaceae sp.]
MSHGNNEVMASNEMTAFHQNQYGKVNEETLASCSRTLNASFEKALEISTVNISTDTSPTEQSSNTSLPSVRQIAKDFEEKRKMLYQRPDASVLSNGMSLSPIPKMNDNEESPLPLHEKQNGPNCLTPPKIVRKDADRVLPPQNTKNLEHVNEKDLFDTPDKQALLSTAPFQYDTPPQKQLFANDDANYFGHLVPSATTGAENEVDTPKTCNTSNLSTSFHVSQIAFDPNKSNSYVDPEESFETFYSQDSNSNRRRSYFDDTFDSIKDKDLPSARHNDLRSPTTLFGRAEKIFYSQVDTLVDKFVMACVQERDVRVKSKQPSEVTKGKQTNADASRQPRVAAV